MARPIKVLCASEDVKTELRRRANGRSNEHRKRFRAEIMSIYHCCSDIVQKSTDGLSQQGYK